MHDERSVSIETEPASPCVGICRLDADSVCVGCARSIGEIAEWGQATAARKRAIVEAASRRVAVLAPQRARTG